MGAARARLSTCPCQAMTQSSAAQISPLPERISTGSLKFNCVKASPRLPNISKVWTCACSRSLLPTQHTRTLTRNPQSPNDVASQVTEVWSSCFIYLIIWSPPNDQHLYRARVCAMGGRQILLLGPFYVERMLFD